MRSIDVLPSGPGALGRSGWWRAIRRTMREFNDDALTDWAAALTYYGVLSIFPGLLVLVAGLGLVGAQATDRLQQTITTVAPEQIGQILGTAIDRIQANRASASVVAIVSLVVAFWSASGYIAAFMRAANAIYDVPEGRPVWKTLTTRILMTATIGLMLLASTAIVVFTGGLAAWAGRQLGLGSTAIAAWGIFKWPVLVILVSLMLATLYWVSPNVRHPGVRWVSPGAGVAVVAWLIVSGGFAIYIANFASYDKTYGALAGIVVLLVWLWLTNIAILFGAELDAELERGRAIAAGQPAGHEPYLPLRDAGNRSRRGLRAPRAADGAVGAPTTPKPHHRRGPGLNNDDRPVEGWPSTRGAAATLADPTGGPKNIRRHGRPSRLVPFTVAALVGYLVGRHLRARQSASAMTAGDRGHRRDRTELERT